MSTFTVGPGGRAWAGRPAAWATDTRMHAAGPFTAPATAGTVTSMRIWNVFALPVYSGSGYYKGDGGEYRWIVRSDDGGKPDLGSNLGEMLFYRPMNHDVNNNAVSSVPQWGADLDYKGICNVTRFATTWTNPLAFTGSGTQCGQYTSYNMTGGAAVTGGQKYWVTWQNEHPNPGGNYYGIEGLTYADPSNDKLHRHYVETSAGSGVFTEVIFDGWPMMALMQVNLSGGEAMGQFPFNCRHLGGNTFSGLEYNCLGTNRLMRNYFEIPGSEDVDIANVYVWLGSGIPGSGFTTGDGPGVVKRTGTITAKLYDNADNLKATDTFVASDGNEWADFTLTATLSPGTDHYFDLTSPSNINITGFWYPDGWTPPDPGAYTRVSLDNGSTFQGSAAPFGWYAWGYWARGSIPWYAEVTSGASGDVTAPTTAIAASLTLPTPVPVSEDTEAVVSPISVSLSLPTPTVSAGAVASTTPVALSLSVPTPVGESSIGPDALDASIPLTYGNFWRITEDGAPRLTLVPLGRSQQRGMVAAEGHERVSEMFAWVSGTEETVMAAMVDAWAANKSAATATLKAAIDTKLAALGFEHPDGTPIT